MRSYADVCGSCNLVGGVYMPDLLGSDTCKPWPAVCQVQPDHQAAQCALAAVIAVAFEPQRSRVHQYVVRST
jgi:hypothetical protein